MGEADDSAVAKLYVGRSGSVGTRLKQHHQKKDFWNRALVVVSLTQSLVQTHAAFLEWHCIAEAKRAGRFALENGNEGSRPFAPAPLQADCLEIFETARILLATLGQPIFEPVAQPPAAAAQRNELFYCTAAGADARGEYTPEGFVVLAGSRARPEIAPSFKGAPFEKKRQALIDDQTLQGGPDGYVFQRDVLFASPSAASSVCVGSRSSGWMLWKDAQGRTLDELKRQPLVSSNRTNGGQH